MTNLHRTAGNNYTNFFFGLVKGNRIVTKCLQGLICSGRNRDTYADSEIGREKSLRRLSLFVRDLALKSTSVSLCMSQLSRSNHCKTSSKASRPLSLSVRLAAQQHERLSHLEWCQKLGNEIMPPGQHSEMWFRVQRTNRCRRR